MKLFRFRTLFSSLRVFNFREKLAVSALIVLVVAALGYWLYSMYVYVTSEVPAYGGTYIEGAVGQPSHVNPLLSQASEADSDLTELIYSGLLRYDDQGNLEGDIAESWELGEDKLTYTVFLRQGVKWHDGEDVLADDVVFTYQLIQNPAYKSPLRQNWQGVEVAQVNDHTVTFTLKKPYFGFLDNLTVGILPKHVWENVGPEKFPLSVYNLEPIGSGPYAFESIQRDSEENILVYSTKAFRLFHHGRPYIGEFVFQFYPDRSAVVEAFKRKEIMGMSSIESVKLAQLGEYRDKLEVHSMRIPHYFLSFFNQTKSIALAYDEVREALSLAVDREELVQEALDGRGTAIQSPFLPETPGTNGEAFPETPNIDRAKQILEENGWGVGEDGVRFKDDVRLEFDIVTVDWPEFMHTADLLREQWREVGIQANVKVVTVFDLGQNYIRPREYDALLFAHATSTHPDLFSYWHSSQKNDPGLNLALFQNDEADELLEKAREAVDQNERAELYRQFQEVFASENPAVYLFSPDYLYPISERVEGITVEQIANPSDRFSHVSQWYVKTKRVFK